MQIFVDKMDRYSQRMTTDSTSSLQMYSSLGTSLEIDDSVSFIGRIFSVFQSGQAEFSFAVAPTFSIVSVETDWTELARKPFAYFAGLDSEMGGRMATDSFPFVLASKDTPACRPGAVLTLTETSTRLGHMGVCTACTIGQYSTHALAAPCKKCPKGAHCPDGKAFIRLPDESDATSEWEIVDGVYRIVTCPPGYMMNRDEELPLDDACIRCEAGTYLLEQSNYSACLNCPMGAVCEGGDSVVAVQGFWREPDNSTKSTIGSSMQTRRSWGLLDFSSSPLFGVAVVSPWREGEVQEGSSNTVIKQMPQLAKMHRCPAGACAKNNVCLQNRTGYACGVCPDGYAFTKAGCELCPAPGDPALIALQSMVLSAGITCFILGYILVAWTPLLGGARKILPASIVSAILVFHGIPDDEVEPPPSQSNSNDGDDNEGTTGESGHSTKPEPTSFSSRSWNSFKKYYFRFLTITTPMNMVWGQIKKSSALLYTYMAPVLSVFTKILRFVAESGETLMDLAEKHKITQHLKIFISFVQVLGSFVGLQVEWPPVLIKFMQDVGSAFQFNIVQLPKLSCLWASVDFQQTLIFTTVGPLLMIVLLGIPLCICLLKAKYVGWTDALSEQFVGLEDQFFTNLLFMSFLIYPICSLTSLQAFDCHETLNVVRVDMRMNCPPLFSFMGIYSVVSFFVYPVGMPVGFWFLLKLMKVPEIARSKRITRAFGNLLTLFIKMTGTYDSKLLANVIGRVDQNPQELDRRIEEFYNRVAFYDTQDTVTHEGHGHETDLRLYRCLHKHFQLKHGQALDKDMTVNLIYRIVERSNALIGLETIENISPKQGKLLLEHEWPLPGMAIKSKVVMRKELVEEIFRRYGDPPREEEWVSPFGKYYPDPTNEENREFYSTRPEEEVHQETSLEDVNMNRGWVYKQGEKNPTFQKRYFALKEDTSDMSLGLQLHYFKDEDAYKDGESAPRGLMQCFGMKVEPDLGILTHGDLKLYSFAIIGDEFFSTRRIICGCETDEDRIQWTQDLAAASAHEESSKEKSERMNYLKVKAQLENLTLKLVETNVISCPVLTWDPHSPNEMERRAIKRIGAIFGMYQVQTWYWELMEMFRKFLMVGVLVFIFPGEPAQLGVGMLIVFFFLVLQLRLQPCATKDLNNMQAVSQISLMLTLFVGLMLVIERYIQRELDLLAAGPWGVVDSAQIHIRELNKLIFTYIGVGVNLFTMTAPPLLIASRIYLGLGSREEIIAKAKSKMNEVKKLAKSTGLAGKADAPTGDATKAVTKFKAASATLIFAGVGTAVGVGSVSVSQKQQAELPPADEEGKDLEIELELNMSIGEIEGKEEEFKKDLAHDVAQAVGSDVAEVKVLGLHAVHPEDGEAGIIVKLRLAPGMSSNVHNDDTHNDNTHTSRWLLNVMAATELAQQATNANSPLKQGRVTNKSKTLRVTAVTLKGAARYAKLYRVFPLTGLLLLHPLHHLSTMLTCIPVRCKHRMVLL